MTFDRSVQGKTVESEESRKPELSAEEKLAHDAKGLIDVAKRKYHRGIITVDEAFGMLSRGEDQKFHTDSAEGFKLKRAISIEIKNGTLEFTEEQKALLSTIKTRFETQSTLHQGIQWMDVESSLRGNTEAFAALKYMEETGGEPDVLRVEGGEFVFTDTSAESPSGRRNKSHIDATGIIKPISGLELTSEDDYMYLQGLKPVDSNSWSWLGKPSAGRDPLAAGDALDGRRRGGSVDVHPDNADDPYERRGFRCSLRVKKS
ncbi:MAG: hypothetical protein UV80_C0002G0029 [Candidatus Peregrinibacteria bacterium GW2011_GWF2_43_17]|nr:MAG: hypothetical protein UV80_C0002G0029 [Candidatus Peregrinibacteria bacterium GW2011_GWF2_43_17]KKT20557.1 MAG: hypothetical protein UW03_C0002G0023 [Candidatus Peregrinibacteria bacterium GW2011_GWA2_43_8]HAU39924.1 hypothetical protein [Candidatus Peregrinibacteria bacterium]